MIAFEPSSYRKQFPLLQQAQTDSKLVYFDNAATTQKPLAVIECEQHFYQQLNANVHRASHQLSSKATAAYEQARSDTQELINAKRLNEIVWTKGTTESINLVCQSFARKILKPLDEILLTVGEHHANIVPWQIVAEQTGAIIKVLPITKFGKIDDSLLEQYVSKRTRFVAFAHLSNVLAKVNPVKAIIKSAKRVGAYTLIDGAQAIGHFQVDVQSLGCDFYVFSAHKMYGPTGVGVLYGKEQLLESMDPYQGGGEMIKRVSFNQPTTYNTLPYKFEAGTPNIAGIVAFGQAVRFIKPLIHDTHKQYAAYEAQLTRYCFESLQQIPAINFIVEGEPDVGILSFTFAEHHNHDVAAELDSYGIAIRAGHHCAMPLMEHLNLAGCLRVSLSAYNTKDEIDLLIDCLKSIASRNAKPDESAVQVKENKPTPSKRSRSELNSLEVLNNTEAISRDVLPHEKIVNRFKSAKGWDGRHREIMLLSKDLVRMKDAERNDDLLIEGCESKAWLSFTLDEQNRYSFCADSDAKVIRGLLVIILAVYNGKSAQDIEQFAIEHYFEQLGLIQHLSPSRGNGVLAIVNKIKLLAKENERSLGC